jgi:uncharacterized membrane protein
MTATLGAAPLFADQPDVWTGPVAGLAGSLSLIVSGIGVVVIVWGAYSSVLRMIASETAAARGQLSKADAATGRAVFATYLLPGLDFLAAGCAIKTLAAPDWQQAALLGGLVLARTLISLSLRWGVAPVGVKEAVPAAPRLAPPPTPADGVGVTIDEAAPVGAQTVP